jgi:hypothetical protein
LSSSVVDEEESLSLETLKRMRERMLRELNKEEESQEEEGEITSDDEIIPVPKARAKKSAKNSHSDSIAASVAVAAVPLSTKERGGGETEEANNSGGSDKENTKIKRKKGHNKETKSRYW